VTREIEDSKTYLEQLLGHKVSMFCYPKGRYNETIKRTVRNAGFTAARTVNYGDFNLPHDSYEWQITLHASNGSPLMTFKTWLKSGISVQSLIDWEIRAKLLFDLALQKGGIYHLWGHSWEIEKNDEWAKLERVLRYISNKRAVYFMTNGEIFGLPEGWPRGW
jgi:peptidoglycan/xylan/chitin deacetylase (PgdA/CDA1 family)